MKKLININNLTDLLLKFEKIAHPMFVSLSTRLGNDNYLMDKIVAKVQAQAIKEVGYQKLTPNSSKVLKEELMITKNPTLLLIQSGEIKAIFNGIVGQHELEFALENLNSQLT